jgi:uncharacterized membrane protein YidH (DUF202 family)
MIERYSDHAANERTFLAWIRTGIATIAFGFVVEKFNLFVLTLAEANSLDAAKRMQLEKFSGSFSHYDGLALILVGNRHHRHFTGALHSHHAPDRRPAIALRRKRQGRAGAIGRVGPDCRNIDRASRADVRGKA